MKAKLTIGEIKGLVALLFVIAVVIAIALAGRYGSGGDEPPVDGPTVAICDTVESPKTDGVKARKRGASEKDSDRRGKKRAVASAFKAPVVRQPLDEPVPRLSDSVSTPY